MVKNNLKSNGGGMFQYLVQNFLGRPERICRVPLSNTDGLRV